MAVSVNYPSPVNVNGYSCWNCSEVSLAKRNIDPKHPQSGPNNSTAATDPSRKPLDHARLEALKRAAEQQAGGAAAATQANATYSAIGVKPVTAAPGAGFALIA